jgi:hypothetical protein
MFGTVAADPRDFSSTRRGGKLDRPQQKSWSVIALKAIML